MRYCTTCVLPDTRPNLYFDLNGSCCNSFIEEKNKINWVEREKTFQSLVNEILNKNLAYDCIIPVSGGKDSTWQVLKALEYGLKPLCVTWKTPFRTELGIHNLQNLINLGVSHIDFSINPNVEKKFTLKAFKKFGSPVIPMHMALHAIPIQLALNFKIPFILWGENSAYEYGGSKELKGVNLNHAWLKEYGVTNGTTSNDWVSSDLTENELKPYEWPSDLEQNKSGIKALFLGHFFKWDPVKTYKSAKKVGFQAAKKPKVGFYEFADIDDSFLITIHHWMKWYKFGFTRLWDNLSLEIRNNRMTREHAINLIEKKGEEIPHNEIQSFCRYVEISESKFHKIAGRFRNQNIWEKDNNSNWFIKNFLIKNWRWSKSN